jgi:hypothetical protein
MMTQDEMSAAANWAITETRRLLPNGNSNPVEGIPGTMMRSSDPNQQALISAAVDEAYNTQNVGTSHLSSISCAAKIALGEKAGNCAINLPQSHLHCYFKVESGPYTGPTIRAMHSSS